MNIDVNIAAPITPPIINSGCCVPDIPAIEQKKSGAPFANAMSVAPATEGLNFITFANSSKVGTKNASAVLAINENNNKITGNHKIIIIFGQYPPANVYLFFLFFLMNVACNKIKKLFGIVMHKISR